MRWGLASLGIAVLCISLSAFAHERDKNGDIIVKLDAAGNSIENRNYDPKMFKQGDALSKKNWGGGKEESENRKDHPDSKDEAKVTRQSDSDKKKREHEEHERIRQWNITQDRKAYEYRMNQLSQFQGSHGAVAPSYVPSGTGATIPPFVSSEFKDAQGNLWKVIEGSPEKLLELAEEDGEVKFIPPQGEEGSREPDSAPVQDDSTPAEESRNNPPTRTLLSLSSPGTSSSATSSIGAQSNTFNIFLNATNGQATSPEIRTMTTSARDIASLDAPTIPKEETNPKKTEPTGPNLTINNNVSIEGGGIAGGPEFAGGQRAMLLMQKDLASAKGKSKNPEGELTQTGGRRLSLESSYGSRGVANLEGKSHRSPFWLWIALVATLVAIAGREIHKQHWLGFLQKRNRPQTQSAAAPQPKAANRVSEATFATSATRIYRRFTS